MHSLALFTVITSLVASAMASPAAESAERRSIAARVTLCREPNLQDCDDSFVPILSCYRVPECEVKSLSTGGHICDFYSESDCSGSKYQRLGHQQSLPDGVVIRSVRCW
ncbi:hypothetical protein HIM_05479 [Hirsutella minnesotensis 3608]|uniref:Extracellular membrane protein CFEM domain-containing protein n=1 Tax=Hirsutella minnesotensis 3608 TaxID=1043627 RepID=A0A0F7ZUJ9_9HYPO|nr:hypothetical protein HIM_05479 [Hirsutella minnesotensis 3608]